MDHTLTINGKSVTVNISCQHPRMRGNNCPTGSGNCGSCQYCKAELPAPAFLALWEQYQSVAAQ